MNSQLAILASMLAVALCVPVQELATGGFGTNSLIDSNANVNLELTRSQLAEKNNCPNRDLYAIVKNAMIYYNGTNQALGMSQRVTDAVLKEYSGPWISTVSQLDNSGGVTRTQWSYWGSGSVLQSQYWCIVADDTWMVVVGKIAV